MRRASPGDECDQRPSEAAADRHTSMNPNEGSAGQMREFTSDDVVAHRFATGRRRGYDTLEVDEYLEHVAEYIGRLRAELDQFRATERVALDVLHHAQRVADETVTAANRDAEAVRRRTKAGLDGARAAARRMLDEARAEADRIVAPAQGRAEAALDESRARISELEAAAADPHRGTRPPRRRGEPTGDRFRRRPAGGGCTPAPGGGSTRTRGRNRSRDPRSPRPPAQRPPVRSDRIPVTSGGSPCVLPVRVHPLPATGVRGLAAPPLRARCALGSVVGAPPRVSGSRRWTHLRCGHRARHRLRPALLVPVRPRRCVAAARGVDPPRRSGRFDPDAADPGPAPPVARRRGG